MPLTNELALRLERERYEAMLANDADALGAILSDNLVYAHSNGWIDTKSTYLSMIRDGRLKYVHIEHDEVTVTESTNTVVILGSMQAAVILDGQNKHIDNHHVVVWVAEAGKWTMLAYSPTPAAP